MGLKGVGDHLGKTGEVRLTEVLMTGSQSSPHQDTTSNQGYPGYDRDSTSLADDYFRVNPFAVQDGKAPDPETDSAAPFNLSDWDNYDQWNDQWAQGSNFDPVSRTDSSVYFTWTKPTGYDRDQGSLYQRIYYKPCPGDCDTNSSSNDPRQGTNTEDNAPNDASAYNVTGLAAQTTYVFCIVTRHNQDGTGNAGTDQESRVYTAKTPLPAAIQISDGWTSNGFIEDNNASGHYLVVTTLQACNPYTVGRGGAGDGDDDEDGSACADAVGQNATQNSGNPVYARGALENDSKLYSGATCAGTLSNYGANTHVAINLDQWKSYALDGNGNLSGTVSDECFN